MNARALSIAARLLPSAGKAVVKLGYALGRRSPGGRRVTRAEAQQIAQGILADVSALAVELAAGGQG